ncbi:hypothetical protein EJ110_NYTH56384 [Nymphaea thermarum]|nr:hypothetical protein EJ110_NYTH56384 [Nymphaea thermarum]
MVSPVRSAGGARPLGTVVCCAWSVGSLLPNLGVLGKAEYLSLEFTHPWMSALPRQRMKWIHPVMGYHGGCLSAVGRPWSMNLDIKNGQLFHDSIQTAITILVDDKTDDKKMGALQMLNTLKGAPEKHELLKILTWYQSKVQHCPPLISQKLNHSNYLTWKRQIVPFIKSHRLYGHIDGTTPAPPQYIDREVKRTVVADQGGGASTGSEIRFEYETVTENNPANEVWLAHDQSLVAYITSTLSEEVLGGVDDDLTALELWSTLATTYSHVSEARFLQLRRQFQDIKRGTRTVLEYLNEIKSVSDQLAAIGHPVSDKDKVQQALSGLGTEFDIFCTALEVLPILPSIEDLKNKLFQHEASHPNSSILSSSFLSQLISQKLNHSNYLTWKRQIIPFIKSHRLYGHIDGTTPAPPQYIDREVKRTVVADQGGGASTGSEIRFEYETVTENNHAYEVWLAHDQSLVAYITSTLSEEVLGVVDDYLTALELWSTLATTYSQVSEARFLQLRRQFQDIKHGTRTVLEYLNEIKSVSDQLAAIGHPVSDKDKVQQALSGLGTEFDIFCTALEVLPILSSFEYLKAKLFQHEASRVQRQNLISSNIHNVLITGTHAMEGHRTRPWTPQAGMGRGILPTPPGTNTTSSTPRRVPTCFYCNKRGHVKSECWHNPQNKNNCCVQPWERREEKRRERERERERENFFVYSDLP